MASVESVGVDIASGREGSKIGKGRYVVEPSYETIVFELVTDVKNVSDQYLVALNHTQEVFRKSDDGKFRDQRM